MKKRMIYAESTALSDMSKDRVHLNMSYGEYEKLREYIHLSWLYIENEKITKKGKNLSKMFDNATELNPIWDKNK